jgi:hypothetical protein
LSTPKKTKKGTQDPRHLKVFHNFLTFWKKERKQKSKSLGHRERERRVREKYTCRQ